MASQEVPFEFKGLRNTHCRGKVPFNFAYHMWNADTERRSVQSRLGFGENFKRTGHHSGDRCYGAGYGKFGATEQFVLITKRNGGTACTVEIRDADGATGVSVTDASADWTEREDSNWMFTQFDNYVFAVNQADGLWRWKLGGTVPGDWVKVPTRFYYGSDSVVQPFKPPYTLRNYETTAGASLDTVTGRFSNSLTAVPSHTSSQTIAALGVTHSHSGYVFTGNRMFHSILSRPAATYTAMSYTANRMFACSMNVYMTSTLITNSASWVSGGSFAPTCYVSTVATASTTNIASADWLKVPDSAIYTERVAEGSLFPVIHFYVNLDRLKLSGWSESTFAAIRHIAVGAYLSLPASNPPFNVEMSCHTLGGNPMNRPDGVAANFYGTQSQMEANTNLADVEYAFQYYHTTGPVEGEAAILKLERKKVFGEPFAGTTLPPMGASVKLNIVSTESAATFDKIRIWRKRRSDSEKWYLLEELANPGIGTTLTTSEDTRIDAIDNAWAQITTATTLPFSQGSGLVLEGSAIASWKGHLVVGVDNEIYMSWANDPTRFMPPVRLLGTANVPTDDLTIGRTMYMSNDQADSVVALVSQDVLYPVGEKGVYAIVGDSALDATPSRLIARRGTLGRKALCAYAGGVVVGSSDGIWWYRVSRASADSTQTIYDEEELTKDVRASYAGLLADGAEYDLVIWEDQGILKAVRGVRYMERNKDGEWTEGALDIDSLTSGATGSLDPDYPVTGTDFETGVVTGISGTNWTVGTSGIPPLGGSAGNDSEIGGNGGSLDPKPFDPVSPVVDPPPYGVIQGFTIPYRGSKFVSYTGIIFNDRYTEDLIPYRSDAGRPIPWYWAGGVLGDSRTNITGVKLFATNLLAAEGDLDADPPVPIPEQQPLRVIVTSYDGKAGEVVRWYERVAEQIPLGTKADVQLLPWKPCRGYRHVLTVAGRDASQFIDGCTLTIEGEIGTGQGN